MPARFSLLTVTALSSAPHNLPFANVTCCIRVSFESGVEITSLWAGSAVSNSLQHPVPRIVGVVVSLVQNPIGTVVVGGEPDPG